jgi:hypothetical protein
MADITQWKQTSSIAASNAYRKVDLVDSPAISGQVIVFGGICNSSGTEIDLATSTLQTTANGILTTIDTDTGAIATSIASIDTKTPALGQALAAGSIPVVLTAAQQSALTPPAAITGFALESTLGTLSAKFASGTVIGDVNLGATDNAVLDAIAASVAAIDAGQLADGHNVTVSGSVTANIGTVGTLATAAKQDTGNTSLATLAGAVAGTEVQVDIVTMPNVTIAGTVTVGSHAVTNAGTFAVQVDGAALTSLQLLDDSVATTGSAITSKGMAAVGTDGTNARILKTDAAGELQIDVLTLPALAAGTNNIGDVDVLSCALPTGASTLAEQQTQTGHLSNIQDFTETTSTFTSNSADSLALLDDAIVAVDAVGTSAKVIMGGAIRDDALSALTPAEGDAVNMRTDANGALWVVSSGAVAVNGGNFATTNLSVSQPTQSIQLGYWDGANFNHISSNGGNGLPITSAGGAAIPVSLDDFNISGLPLAAGTNNIGDVDILTMPGTGVEDAAETAGGVLLMAGSVRRDTAASSAGTTGDNATINTDAVGALWTRDTATQVDDAAFTPATSRVVPVAFLADETATDSVDEGDGGAARMTLDRKQIVTPQPHTAGGLSIFRSLDLDETEEEVKATAGQLYGGFVTNTSTGTRWIKFYNATAANVTVGTTTPVITWGIQGGATDDVAAVLNLGGMGIEFTTAISVAATTGVADADTGAPGANDVIINLFYK